MRGYFITKGIIFGMITLLILPIIIPGNSIKTTPQTIGKKIDILPLPISGKTTSVSFFVFGRTGFETQNQILSSREATGVYSLLQELMQEAMAHPFSKKTLNLKKEVIHSLEHAHLLSSGIGEKINTVFPSFQSQSQFQLPFLGHTKNINPTTQTNITRLLCSIGSQGVGTILPPIQIPRPRLAGLWTGGAESSTSIISFIPYGGATASGKQIGVALGFIGLGASFAFPEAPVYVLFGYAIIIHITAESIETFP